MLGFAESKALIAPKTFRGFDHATLALKLHAELPQLEHLFIVGGDGETSFEQQLLNENTQPVTSGSALTPNDVMQLLYTSGTTGVP
jgi:cyclohexanecarboxylate-CoA ligase